ncbi:hypothetical protein [Rosistilla oblonga]|uniref:hypothetical protein n=1 Tax=Rosistilla oblonga TaxID=2527990 RepID=UPI003A9786A1
MADAKTALQPSTIAGIAPADPLDLLFMNAASEQPQFDPYHQWLGIPPDQQPANLYRLLGLERFESDADVIDVAANRQIAYLRQVGVGAKRDPAKRLVAELADARRVLLSPPLRKAYDRQLIASSAPQSDDLENRTPDSQPSESETIRHGPSLRIPTRPPQKHSRRKRQRKFALGGTAILTVLVVVGGGYLATRGPTTIATPATKTVTAKVDPAAPRRHVVHKPIIAGVPKPPRHVASDPKTRSLTDVFDQKFRSAQQATPAATSSPDKQADSLPILVDFEGDAWRAALAVDDLALFNQHHSVRDGKLFVLQADDESYIGTPLRLKNVNLTAEQSLAVDARIPKGLKHNSGVALQAGDFTLALRVDSRSTLLAGTVRSGVSIELASIPYESDPQGLQQPYRLRITCPPADSTTYSWRIDVPSGEAVEGTFAAEQTMTGGEAIVQAWRYDARNSHFWIDNLASDTLDAP